jgi:hypothetical protein
MIAANNGWLVVLDNVSRVCDWLSDALCRLSTGGGAPTRRLWTDQEEVLFDAKRPVILNGIEEMVTRSDLLDRCITLHLPKIPPDQRRTEAEISHEFEKARPRILGALLDVVAGALREAPSVRLRRMPRMADFANLGVAVERALGWPKKSFLHAYEENHAAADHAAFEASPVIIAMMDLLGPEYPEEWSGTFTELLRQLGSQAPLRCHRSREWPETPRKLSGILQRYAPNLRAAGWEIVFPKDQDRKGRNRDRIVTIRPPPKTDESDSASRNRPPSDDSQVPLKQDPASLADEGDDVDGVLSFGAEKENTNKTNRTGGRPSATSEPSADSESANDTRLARATVEPDKPDEEAA